MIKTEIKVGVFALIVIAILSLMTFWVGGFAWLKKEGYNVKVYFKSAAGIDKKSRIRVAGVEGGVVEDIALADGKAKVTLRVYPSIKLYSDATVSIKTVGLLGEKYLELGVGSTKPLLKDGDTITNVVEMVDVDDLIRKITEVSSNITTFMGNLNQVISEDKIEALRQTIDAFRDTAVNASVAVRENDKRFRVILESVDLLVRDFDSLVQKNEGNLTELVSNLKELSATLKRDTPEFMSNIKDTSSEIRTLVADSRGGIQSIVNKMDRIAGDLEEGKGTLGKLLKDERLYNTVSSTVENLDQTLNAAARFRTFLDFQGQHLSGARDTKGRFLLTLKPKPDKYYIIGITSDPIARVKTEETIVGGTVTKKEIIKKDIEFTAQIARRFDNTALRIGITENTFGVGADHFLANDKIKLSVDAWDFSKDEAGANNPHVSVGLEYSLFKNLYLSAGYDNILNSRWRGVSFGGGVRFEDEDFKYLLGTAPKLR